MPKTPRKQYFASEFPDICDTVSSCECTGLMPSPPTNDAERAAGSPALDEARRLGESVK